MANTQQQRKRVRIAERQHLENLRYKSSIKTYFRRLKATAAGGDADSAQEVAKRLASTIDKAAAKKAIHKNKAARKKSQVSRILSEM